MLSILPPRPTMTEPPDKPITLLLEAVQAGESHAAAELLPLVYNELRALARSRMGRIAPGQTLQPTALVHEAYMKLVGDEDPGWENRRHFFGAAALAMRDIIVDQARRKSARKRGGDRRRIAMDHADTPDISIAAPVEDLVALDDALRALEAEAPDKAEIVMLRYFAGLSRDETAAALGVTTRTIDRQWRYVVARLHQLMHGRRDDGGPPP
ncbi:MAG: sigma-70 family RNA polymerase sigma factor [Phycisphaerales bacterium]|nr:sigma-70 family RNA polymerase sigma factor [Phycisphaerales bacterium]